MPPVPPDLYRVYVDESGDRGMTGKSSPFFVLAAVIVKDQDDVQLRGERDQLCVNLGKPATTVLHWAENIKQHGQRKYTASLLGGLPYVRLSYVIVDKDRVRAQGTTGLSDHSKLYNYALRRLLERLSWCIRDSRGEAIVTLAHVRRFPYAKLASYLAHLRGSQTSIAWSALRGDPRIESQNRVELLQVADIAAGCLDAALTPDRFGQLESSYLASIAPRIYARPPGPITSYGMNIIGDKAAPGSLTGALPWWAQVFP